MSAMLKRWWGRLQKRRMETKSVGRDGHETADETGGPRDETGDKMAATVGDERDGSDRWGNIYGRMARWRPWACHATNHKNFIYQPIFTIFAATNSELSRL